MDQNQLPQSQQPVAPQPSPVSSNDDPGRTLGILSLIFAFILPIIGIIVGIVGLRKSKAAGYKNNVALAGLIISFITTVLILVTMAIAVPTAINAIQEMNRKCSELGPGTHQVGNTTYTCGDTSTLDDSSSANYDDYNY
jgi:hypothetical protein